MVLKITLTLEAVQKLAAEENVIVVPLCNQIEAEISLLEDEDRAEFLEALGMEEPGLNVVIRAGYGLLWPYKLTSRRVYKKFVLGQ